MSTQVEIQQTQDYADDYSVQDKENDENNEEEDEQNDTLERGNKSTNDPSSSKGDEEDQPSSKKDKSHKKGKKKEKKSKKESKSIGSRKDSLKSPKAHVQKVPQSTRAGLHLPVGRIGAYVRTLHGDRVSKNSVVELTGGVEAILGDIIGACIPFQKVVPLTKKEKEDGITSTDKRKRITPRLLMLAMNSTPSMKFLSDTMNSVFVGSGVSPSLAYEIEKEKKIRQNLESASDKELYKILGKPMPLKRKRGQEEEEKSDDEENDPDHQPGRENEESSQSSGESSDDEEGQEKEEEQPLKKKSKVTEQKKTSKSSKKKSSAPSTSHSSDEKKKKSKKESSKKTTKTKRK